MQDFTEQKNRYQVIERLIKEVSAVHTFFKKHPRFKTRDYVLSGETTLSILGLSEKVLEEIRIYVNNKRNIEQYSNSLKKSGFTNVKVVKKQSPELLTRNSLTITPELNGEKHYINIPSIEKMLINIDSYHLLPDDKITAVSRLYKKTKSKQLIKIISFYSSRKMKISKEAKYLLKQRSQNLFNLQTEKESFLIDSVLKNLKDKDIILFGGTAINKQTGVIRPTRDIDFLGKKEVLPLVVKSLKDEFQVRDGHKEDRENKNHIPFSKVSILYNGGEKSTILLKEKGGKDIDNEDISTLLKIDFDHTNTDPLFKNNLTKKLDNVGHCLTPETLVCMKIETIFSCLGKKSKLG